MPHAIHQPSSKAGTANHLFAKALPSEHDKIVQQTQKWVAQTFYGTLLKQVRQSPFHSKQFEGGRGGEAFGSMYDQRLAEHMARGTGQKLVNAIARKIEAKNAYSRPASSTRPKTSYQTSPSLMRSIHATTALRA
jgi:Rod binding domain-containing protein